MNNAAPPKRASGSITLGFGAVSFPVKVYSGSEDISFKRSEYTRDDEGNLHKVGRAPIDKDSGEVIRQDQIIKMVELDDTVIELSDEEIQSVLQPENGVASIECFVSLDVLGTGRYVPNGIMQIRPDKGAGKPFSLVVKAMKRKGVFALVKLTMRGKNRYAAFLPTGRLYTLLQDAEVREDRPLDLTDNLDPDEQEMIDTFVDIKTVEIAPDLVDDTIDKLTEYVRAKATGDIEAKPTPAPAKGTSDLLDALKASVEAAKAQKGES